MINKRLSLAGDFQELLPNISGKEITDKTMVSMANKLKVGTSKWVYMY